VPFTETAVPSIDMSAGRAVVLLPQTTGDEEE
jgi:hypothetical protein